MGKKAYRLSVLIVEQPSGVAAIACQSADACAVGRGQSAASAVAHSVKALESGYTKSRAEAKAIIDSAEAVWGEELKRAAMGETHSRRLKRHR